MAITVWILGDQLLADHPVLDVVEKQHGRDNLVVLMIESEARARRYPYQQKKLVLLFSAMRHYCERLRTLGYQVDYRISPRTTLAVKSHIEEYQPESIFTMAASEFLGRRYQNTLSELIHIPVTILPNTQFITGIYNPIPNPKPNKRYVQEKFYRKIRQHFDLMMQSNGEPIGGKWNFDKENRLKLPKDTEPSAPITFTPDQITATVMKEVNQKFNGVGGVTGFNLAVTHKQAQLAATDFFDNRLLNFGAYEDAMSSMYDTIYHSRLSCYINLGLLDPLKLATEAQNRYINGQAPVNSVEGFIRQIVGWREFIYWQYWRLMPELMQSNYWKANRQLPKMFWDQDTKLNCLCHVITRALESGYTHHIERLMIITNFCLLAGIDPISVNDWFITVFIDAYDWVMAPNALGMGLFADGGLIATKPYFSTSNYIHKMSDYCLTCYYDHKQRTGEKACPYNYLYWNFILKHENVLRSNPRMGRSLLGLRHLDSEQRRLIINSSEKFLNSLS